ncbi:MAG: PAS domain-containing sensor histidine kinase, partial [Deltaproteobacteria bacterium]|nr:PAS domain-containing sensor histidine kinase [Deltaproteobacteria bacterium]
DLSGKVLYANPFFEKNFKTKNGSKNKLLLDIIRDTKLQKIISEFSEQGAKWKIKESPIEINIGKRIFNLRFVLLSEVTLPSLLLFFRDTTEEKQVEAIKRDFVANVSHELRTPLASIKGYSETLLDGGLNDRTTLEDFLRIIDKHATRMSRLIDDLLILSRLESQQFPMITNPADIDELVNSVTDSLRKQARDKGVELVLEKSGKLPQISTDRDRLEQVLVNLLDNAIKYTPAGGKVQVRLFMVSGAIKVEVSDNGIGIPPQDMPRIFERFYRVDKARSRELGGTGLGLAIVKHIIQSLGGTIDVESKLGEGTVFSISLKLPR